MTWQPPDDWQDELRNELSAAAHNTGRSMSDIGRQMGGRARTTPLGWMSGTVPSLPGVRSLVRYCAAVGVAPSELLRRAGL